LVDHMAGSHIVYDGLWRCLCPSVGFGTLTKALRTPRIRPIATASRASLCNRTRRRDASTLYPARRAAAETYADAADHADREYRRYLDRADGRARWLHKLLSLAPDATFERLDGFSTQQIYDAIRELQNMEAGYRATANLVQFLVGWRKEAPNALLYEALIRANVDPFLGSARVVDDLLTEMSDAGISTTPGIYSAILQVTAIHPDYILRSKALLDMKHRWYNLTLDSSISVVLGLLRDGQYELALERLEELTKSPVIIEPWVFSIFLIKFGELGFHAESFQLLQHAVRIKLNQQSLLSWAFLLEVYSRDGYYPGITYIWEKMVAPSRLSPPDGVVLQVLNAASRHGDVGLATDALHLLTERGRKLGVHHYEALMEANLARNHLEKAFTLICLMDSEGLTVDVSATRSILQKLQRSEADTNRALTALAKLRSERSIPITAFNVVLEALVSQRGFQAALDYYRAVRQFSSDAPDLRTFHILLSRCTKETSRNFIIAEMEAFSVKPSRATYDRLIRITVRQHNYEPAFHYLKKIKDLRRPSGSMLTSTSSASNIWMGRATALELIKRCIRSHDPRAQELLEESRERGMNLDADLEQFVAEMQGGPVAAGAAGKLSVQSNEPRAVGELRALSAAAAGDTERLSVQPAESRAVEELRALSAAAERSRREL